MNDPAENRPTLRHDIDLMPVAAEDGSQLIVVRDPLELAGQGTLALRAEALGVLALLDGSHSLEDIRRTLVAKTARDGQLTNIPTDMVQRFLDQLDAVYLLDNHRYQLARRALVEEFTRRSRRPAALTEKSYPADPAELTAFLDNILAENSTPEGYAELEGRELVALVAPHIELSVGKKQYAASYNALRGRSYDRVVVLGVGHSLDNGLFSVSGKDFETPLGVAPTDRVAVRGFADAAGKLLAPDDFAHRSEHSIEFQVLFLQHLLEGPFSLVPILCGSLHTPLIDSDCRRPGEIEVLRPALYFLAGLLSNRACRTLVVAGVDFSHVGMKFGDRKPGIQLTRDSSALDRALLTALAAKDVETFCAENRKVGDRYHVCGFSTLSMLLETLPGECRGVELGYQVWHEHATQSAVSFGAAAFYLP